MEMEMEEIGRVLSRASDLRCKINHCIIDRAAQWRSSGRGGGADSSLDGHRGGGGDVSKEEEEEEEEEESLLDIRDALESLEQQLSSLQALEQQQRYEREAALAQIDGSRMMLLNKIKEYKGEDFEVLHEASTFAGGSVKHDHDLLLPPYTSHLPDTFALDDLYTSSPFTSKCKFYRNGLATDSTHEAKKSAGELTGNVSKGIKFIFGLVAKSTLTVVSIVSILTMAGFEPKLRRRGTQLKATELFQELAGGEKHVPVQCPPGKVSVMENGTSRCVVKERVEIPFESVGKSPNVSYGFG